VHATFHQHRGNAVSSTNNPISIGSDALRFIPTYDRFVNEKITGADPVRFRHAVTKVRDGDVLTYGTPRLLAILIV